jgi:hypothetical protein
MSTRVLVLDKEAEENVADRPGAILADEVTFKCCALWLTTSYSNRDAVYGNRRCVRLSAPLSRHKLATL